MNDKQDRLRRTKEQYIKIAKEALKPFTKSGKFKITELSYDEHMFGDMMITILTPIGVTIRITRDKTYIDGYFQAPDGKWLVLSSLLEVLGLKPYFVSDDLSDGISNIMKEVENNWKLVSASLQDSQLVHRVYELEQKQIRKLFPYKG